ncbi:MAG TPA: response regulator, partial [Planctomycetota bacterium]|nr:response regulator [Planctomycetota bacterium]
MTHAPPVILQVDRRLGETRLLRTELRRRGATVVMTDRAGDAIEIARRSPPDLLVLDEDMEAATGIDLTGHFRSTYPEAGLILLSSRPGSIPLGVGLGLLYHGLRPVSSATLLDLAGRALEGRLVESEPPSEPGPLVMCVDDDPAALKSLSRILGSHGYRVATFQDSQGALGAIPEIGPDVAVIDVLMPGMDGRELSKQIRERYRGLFPIVM